MNERKNYDIHRLILPSLLRHSQNAQKKDRFKMKIIVVLNYSVVLKKGLIKTRIVSPADLLTKRNVCIQLNTWWHFLWWHPASSKLWLPHWDCDPSYLVGFSLTLFFSTPQGTSDFSMLYKPSTYDLLRLRFLWSDYLQCARVLPFI